MIVARSVSIMPVRVLTTLGKNTGNQVEQKPNNNQHILAFATIKLQSAIRLVLLSIESREKAKRRQGD